MNSDGKAEDASARMRRALDAVADGTGSRTEIETAARELVSKLRLETKEPEQMLLRIKQILAEAGLRSSYAPAHEIDAPIGPGNAIYRDVIAWSIRFYFDEESST